MVQNGCYIFLFPSNQNLYFQSSSNLYFFRVKLFPSPGFIDIII